MSRDEAFALSKFDGVVIPSIGNMMGSKGEVILADGTNLGIQWESGNSTIICRTDTRLAHWDALIR